MSHREDRFAPGFVAPLPESTLVLVAQAEMVARIEAIRREDAVARRCPTCGGAVRWVHSKKNTDRLFLGEWTEKGGEG